MRYVESTINSQTCEATASRKVDVVVFAPTQVGGLAEHIHYQIQALISEGVLPLVLTPRDAPVGRMTEHSTVRCLMTRGRGTPHWFMRVLRYIAVHIVNQFLLAWYVVRYRPRVVFTESYYEYCSPFWLWPHLFLSWTGVRYGTNLHDPIRGFRIGPTWWHRLSVWLAYLPYSFVIVHQRIPDQHIVPRWVKVVEAPVGVYQVDTQYACPEAIRDRLSLRPDSKLFLSFGFLRDNKNLNLFIEAMKDVPSVFLFVVGRPQSATQQPVRYYQDLAARHGVADRVVFEETFVPDHEIASYFLAADFVLLTYDRSFVSQSGVLNIAARVKKPVLCSSGPSPLRDSVLQYRLGEFARPDSVEALVGGLNRLLACDWTTTADWSAYYEYASWKTNARELIKAAGL